MPDKRMEWEVYEETQARKAQHQFNPNINICDLPRIDQLPNICMITKVIALLVVCATVTTSLLSRISDADMAEHGDEIREQIQAEMGESILEYLKGGG